MPTPSPGPDSANRSDYNSHPISVTVTDVSCGQAAEGVLSVVERLVEGNWQAVARAASDSSGSIYFDNIDRPGLYRIELDSDLYFATVGVVSLLPRITLTIRITEAGGHCLLEAYIAANSQFSALIRNDYPRARGATSHA